MASNGWKRAMHFLGLVEDYEDDYADLPVSEPATVGSESEPPPAARHQPPPAARPEPSNVRRIPTATESGNGGSSSGPASVPASVQPTGTVNVLGSGGQAGQKPKPAGPRVADHVHVTSPSAFNDVEEVGENFRDAVPVLMNLQGASETVAKRLLDFASGLIYGLDGRIDRTGDRIFLLTPTDVEISPGEVSRLQDRGLIS